ncbi:fibronectin type III domain-containing protein [Marinobacter salexigens]|uniref:fibronectin type III domain-containing protein n=1 Tax=Marinobacter salexigens TaxID=1925763 RepID=UPI001EFE3D3C|nr:fibronectin type III domain-containing protein [Marinobacter salexigens]
MKRVIKLSRVWVAAFCMGVLLAGCGGGSDSVSSESVGSNSKTVDSEGGKAAVLSWSAPKSRVNGDGIAMGELNKYIIQYGKNADRLDHKVIVEGAQEYAEMTHKVSNLDAGIWYFTILVEDSNGLQSAPSEPVNKEIKS